MKKILPIMLILFLSLNGCVSLKKYNDLKTRYEKETAGFEERSKSLESELGVQRARNEFLNREVARFHRDAEHLHAKGMEAFGIGHYDEALEYLEQVVEKYPADPLARPSAAKIAELKKISTDNYQKISKAVDGLKDHRAKIDLIERELDDRYLAPRDIQRLILKKEALLLDLKLQEEMMKHTIVEDDPTQRVKYYRSTRPSLQQAGYEKSFYVELYFIQDASGKKNFRLRTRYVGNRWISYDMIIIRGDNGTQAEIVCKYPEKLSSMSDEKIQEWSDNDIDDEKVTRIAKAHSINVRFHGGYRYAFNLNDEQMLAFREIVRRYNSLK